MQVPRKQRKESPNYVSHKARAAGDSCCPGAAFPERARRTARYTAGVLRAVVNAGKQVLLAMMEADRVARCGAKSVPDTTR